jgi:hypothetical protein
MCESQLTLVAKQKEQILNWLSTGLFNARHEIVRETHDSDTGKWLLNELQDWQNGLGPRIILCTGAGID